MGHVEKLVHLQVILLASEMMRLFVVAAPEHCQKLLTNDHLHLKSNSAANLVKEELFSTRF
jgi:hypothetical protein